MDLSENYAIVKMDSKKYALKTPFIIVNKILHQNTNKAGSWIKHGQKYHLKKVKCTSSDSINMYLYI